jgi:hypothetical protein
MKLLVMQFYSIVTIVVVIIIIIIIIIIQFLFLCADLTAQRPILKLAQVCRKKQKNLTKYKIRRFI